MKKQWYFRAVSLLLAFVLVMQLAPQQIWAAGSKPDTEKAEPGSAAVDIDGSRAPATIVDEVDDLRTETEKHFRLSDGSYIAVNYGLPVHYQDDAGSWQDIDNTLTLVTDRSGVQVYRTGNEAAPAAFAADLRSGDLFTSAMGDASVSMSLLDTGKAMQMVSDSRGEAAAGALKGGCYNRDAAANVISDAAPVLEVRESGGWTARDVLPEKLHSSIRYNDVFPGVDLLYTAYSCNIKEQIIVNTPQSAYRYDFLLRTRGLTAVLNEDGSVSLINAENVTIYSIPAPYMEDAAQHASRSAAYTLTPVPEGVILTVEADPAWMNDEARVYPVSIDPSLITEVRRGTTDAAADIHATYVIQGTPTTTQSDHYEMYLGYVTYLSQKLHRGFMYFQGLPTIPQGSVVTDATLNLSMELYTSVACPTIDIGLYEVTGDNPRQDMDYYRWIYYMNWDGQPAYNTSNMIDYATISAADTGKYVSWDMTELVKKWYIENTGNRTIALAMPVETGFASNHCAAGKFFAYSSKTPPILVVSYRSNVGVEPYYTYSTVGAGAAGAGYIADNSGQLKVLNTLLGFASTVNPFALNLVYNSDYFAANNSADYQPMAKMGLTMQCGSGWTLDTAQRIVPETISNTAYLRYHDGDGTVHYFLKDPSRISGYYYDEDGLGLKIMDNGNRNYQMSDDRGNTWTFTGGYLSAMADANGNQYQIVSSGGKITSIVQKNRGGSAITVASVAYSGNNIASIRDYAGRVYTFTYSDSKLTAISMDGVKIAAYAYSGRRLTKMTDTESGYSISLGYTNGRVSSYQELAGANGGGQVSITYPNYSETVYRDHGKDRVGNTGDDLITHYQFDNAGRTVNAYTTDNGGNILGASNAAYSGSGSTDKTNNRTLRTASIGVAAQQMMRNSGFEMTAKSVWSLSSGMVVSSANPRTGYYCLRGTGSAGTVSASEGSDALTAGKTYTLSAYVNTASMTGFAGKGIYLTVRDAGGNSFVSDAVNYKTSGSMDGGWVRLVLTFTARVTGTHTVGICCENAAGTFYADDFQLELGKAPSNRNLVENGSVQSSTFAWNMGDGASMQNGIGLNSTSPDARAIKIVAATDAKNGNAWQDININLPGTQTYVLSGWAKANAVPDNAYEVSDPTWDQLKQFGLRLLIMYADATYEYAYVPFNPELTGWQFVSTTVVPRQTGKTVAYVKVLCAYERNGNTAYFDNISLVRETAQTMKYDQDGNLVSAASTGLKQDTSTYAGGNLIKTVTGGSGTYTYTYDTTYKHRLVSVSNGPLTQTMEYDGMGNVTATRLTGFGDRSLQTAAEYDAGGNLLTAVTDNSGNSAFYDYGTPLSKMLGLPTSVIDPNGVTIDTAHDKFGRITQNALASAVNLSYNYKNGMLDQLIREADGRAQTYSFGYDAFGNRTSLAVGDHTLATYEYAAKNGLLASQSFGNGDKVSYTYDDLGRVVKAAYSSGRVLTYTYTGDGQLYSLHDSARGLTYIFAYDTLGRLIGQYQRETEIRSRYTYDDCSRLTRWDYSIPGFDDGYETYTYNANTADSVFDGALTGMRMVNGGTISYTYDHLQRLANRAIGGNLREQYTYAEGKTANADTTRISGKTNWLNGAADQDFRYTYDGNGNILTVTDAVSGETTVYAYDCQNQLLSAVTTNGDQILLEEHYTYDGAGNILTSSGGYGSHTYTYGDESWRDLLTAVDGHPITYDGAGNPTGYYNGYEYEMTWTEGRRLESLTWYGETYSYEYDAAGVRTKKNNPDGSSVVYEIVDGRAVGESYIDADGHPFRQLRYIFDETGTAAGFSFRRTERGSWVDYYLVKNLQGDVLKVCRADTGAVEAAYTYDAWGNVLTMSGPMSYINPFLYRSYYFDCETWFYYLQSRYYDPALHRFINADSYASTGQGFVGTNVFAYCVNNPVNMVDVTGNLPQFVEDIFNFVDENIIKPAQKFVDDFSEDYHNFNRNNESEKKVLESHYFSSYKGVPVVRTNLPRSGSFGIIFLSRKEDISPEDTVRHEYGHTKQLEELGLLRFAVGIGIPSWREWGEESYFERPWEITADIYGGVQSRNHSQEKIDAGFAYLLQCKCWPLPVSAYCV